MLSKFGNAQNSTNKDSSRFSNSLHIQYTDERAICKVEFEPQILEKARITNQQAGETNFHIFGEMFHMDAE